MNERIRELAEQANASFGTGLEFAVVFGELEDFNKFAELIVKECVTLINSENYREHSKGWNDAIEWADGMIKEHFGVEE